VVLSSDEVLWLEVRDFSLFSRKQLQYLIAEYVHQVLPPLVYVTQAIHDQRLLAAPEGRMRLSEARAFTLGTRRRLASRAGGA
jgi:hypothetical protein